MSVKKKEKILIAMSGGVDSSVAAALLLKQGYDVTGAFMVNYDEDNCWRKDYQDALRVAAKLSISLLRLDFQKEYKKLVLDYMYKEYGAGRTPNPDVLCNKFVKFGVWLGTAKKLGFDKLATGHYAKIRRSEDQKIKLLRAKDENKDQTYFLHQLIQQQLKHVLFPLGDYLKSKVRSLAHSFNLPTAEKEESMGICFVGEVPMKEFLQKKIKIKKGDIILSDGTVVGEHEGLAFYTIGQRHIGLQIADCRMQNSEPLYVVDKSIKKNQLIIGYEGDTLLYKKEVIVEDVNWIGGFIQRSPKGEVGQKPKFPLKCEVRLRYRQPLQKCMVCHCEEEFARRSFGSTRDRLRNLRHGKLMIKFNEPQRAVTPGQFAVFYKNKECLGGGIVV